MRLKSELYETQQTDIRNKLITMLDLEHNKPLLF